MKREGTKQIEVQTLSSASAIHDFVVKSCNTTASQCYKHCSRKQFTSKKGQQSTHLNTKTGDKLEIQQSYHNEITPIMINEYLN